MLTQILNSNAESNVQDIKLITITSIIYEFPALPNNSAN